MIVDLDLCLVVLRISILVGATEGFQNMVNMGLGPQSWKNVVDSCKAHLHQVYLPT